MTKQITAASRIRHYLEAHPHAADKEVARALNLDPNRVATVKWRDKTHGKPKRMLLRTTSAPAPRTAVITHGFSVDKIIRNLTILQAKELRDALNNLFK